MASAVIGYLFLVAFRKAKKIIVNKDLDVTFFVSDYQISKGNLK